MEKNIIKMGDIYKIYSKGIQGVSQLPNKVLEYRYTEANGYFLKEVEDVKVTKKLYGNHEEKVNKVLNSFKNSNESMGVMYGGKKGTGKSISANLIAQKANELDMPVIVINKNLSGEKEFLDQIKQEVVVLFDEFEKVYEPDEQAKLLNLFDGLSSTKKLFVITFNEESNISEFIINRPGRFRYRYNFDTLSNDVLQEYIEDNVSTPNIDETINKLKVLNSQVNLNFDFLNAICQELNQGYSLQETLEDLNVQFKRGFDNKQKYLAEIKIDKRMIKKPFIYEVGHNYCIEIDLRCFNKKAFYSFGEIIINPKNVRLNDNDKLVIRKIDDVKVMFDYDTDDNLTQSEKDKIEEKFKEIDFKTLTITKDIDKVINLTNLI